MKELKSFTATMYQGLIAAILSSSLLLSACKQDESTPLVKEESAISINFYAIAGSGVTNDELETLKERTIQLAHSGKSSRLTSIISSRDFKLNIKVAKNDPEIRIGHFLSSTIDIGDIDRMPVSGPASQSACLAHEIEEQYQKQREGVTDYRVAHEFAKETESAVGGYTRIPGQDKDIRRAGSSTFPITLSGNCNMVSILYENGNVTGVNLTPCAEDPI